jgi:hypothetical protein
MCGENERPISFGDKSIMFIRLTLANADDPLNFAQRLLSTASLQRRSDAAKIADLIVNYRR